MTQTSLNFQWTALTIALSILTLAIACAMAWVAWKRSGYRRSVGWLELIRIGIVGFCVVLLNQPEAEQLVEPNEKPTIVILADQSTSMDTQDFGLDDSSSAPLVTRSRAIEPLLEQSTWSELADRMKVVIKPFATEQKRSQSNLYQAIIDAKTEHNNLRAIVLASDGDWNEGLPPVQAAIRLRQSKIPIFAVAIGSQTRLPNLDLISFDVPTFGIVGKNVRLPFTIESSLPKDHVADVELTTSDGVTIKHTVRIAAMGRTSDAVLWKPEQVGEYTLSLAVPNHPEERLFDDNRKATRIVVREEKLKVLIVESYPRWEYRYLRNALSRDPGVEVNCLLFHPGLSKVGGGNRDYIPAFPDALEELSQYDVVFLGDVGVDEGQLTNEQCRLLKGLVEQQASGLVFMPGFKGHELSLVDTPLDALLPVVLDDSQPTGWGSQSASHFALTEVGQRSLLTKLADTTEENLQVWENLPGFQWHAPVIRSKAGAEVLAVHQESSNEFGRIPLLVTRTFGTGKVLFMGTDGAWRWRRGVEDLYHYRFWGQVVRWMAYQRNMAKGERMRLFYSPEQPEVGQTISLNANVMQTNGEPLNQGDVTVRMIAPSGRTETVRLTASGEDWGAFAGSLVVSETGTHQVIMRCKENESELETSIFVQGLTQERVGKPARPEVMEELARVSGGKLLLKNDPNEILKLASQISEPPLEIRRLQLWSHPLVAGMMLLLLGAFWIGRKMAGLI